MTRAAKAVPIRANKHQATKINTCEDSKVKGLSLRVGKVLLAMNRPHTTKRAHVATNATPETDTFLPGYESVPGSAHVDQDQICSKSKLTRLLILGNVVKNTDVSPIIRAGVCARCERHEQVEL